MAIDIFLIILATLLIAFIAYSCYGYYKETKAYKKRQNDDIK